MKFLLNLQKYFSEADTLKEDTLLSVAKEFGFDESEVKSYINKEQENVLQKALMWSNKGISGKDYCKGL